MRLSARLITLFSLLWFNLGDATAESQLPGQSQSPRKPRRYLSVNIGTGAPHYLRAEIHGWLWRNVSIDLNTFASLVDKRDWGGFSGGASYYYSISDSAHHLVSAVHAGWLLAGDDATPNETYRFAFIGPLFGYAYLGDHLEIRVTAGFDFPFERQDWGAADEGLFGWVIYPTGTATVGYRF